jgi:hypothetical protein
MKMNFVGAGWNDAEHNDFFLLCYMVFVDRDGDWLIMMMKPRVQIHKAESPSSSFTFETFVTLLLLSLI